MATPASAPGSLHKKSTSFASTPRNLQKLGYMEEHSLIRMELVEARKIEELREEQAANARREWLACPATPRSSHDSRHNLRWRRPLSLMARVRVA